MRVAEEISARNVMVDADFSAAEAAEVLFRPIRARAVKRIRFLMVDPFDFKMLIASCPMMLPLGVNNSPLAIRAQMKAEAWLSEWDTAGTEFPPRSRMMTTTLRLPRCEDAPRSSID